MSFLFLLILFALSSPTHAQEHTGNGVNSQSQQQQERHHSRRRSQQQQQQQEQQNFKKNIIRGKEAGQLFQQLSKDNVIQDWSSRCSQKVMVVYNRDAVCFDRGEGFDPQFKCYVTTSKPISSIKEWIFEVFHNDCGGDGIYSVKVQ